MNHDRIHAASLFFNSLLEGQLYVAPITTPILRLKHEWLETKSHEKRKCREAD